MNQNSQEEILKNNSLLLRKSLLMPQQTKLEAFKRILELFVKNGVDLFNKWCPPYQPNANLEQNQPQSPPDESAKRPIKYSFQHFIENNTPGVDEDVEKADKSFNKSSKQPESISDDPENSKIIEEEHSFVAHFKKGRKRMKRDASESSFQREPKKMIRIATKQEIQFYEAVNFSVFAEMQKNLLEARKKCKDKSEEVANSKCAQYIKYAMKAGSLTTQSQSKGESSSNLNRIEASTRKDRGILRKKVLFEDESHQLYDLAKVYETLDAEKHKRQEHRRLILELKRREEQEKQKKIMMERIQLQRQIQAKKREQEETARRQKEIEERQKQLAQERLLAEQRQKQEEENQKKASTQNINLQASQKESEEVENKQSASVANIIPSKSSEQKIESPKAIQEPIFKKPSEQKKQQNLFGTPIKSGQKQEQKTPFKIEKTNNPFCNPPAKPLNLQDLINNHKPSENAFLPASNVASPPRSNIFSNQNPVNNLFTGGQLFPPSLSTNSAPAPAPAFMKEQPQAPPAQLSSFTNPVINNQSPNFVQNPQSFFTNIASPGFGNNITNNGIGFNSATSSPAISSAFPAMQTAPNAFSKNLFMDQPSQGGLFGGTTTSTSSSSRGNAANRKKQIRIS